MGMRKIKSYFRYYTNLIKSFFKKPIMYKDINYTLNNITTDIIRIFRRFSTSTTIYDQPNPYFGYLIFPSDDQFFLGEKRFSITFSNYPMVGISSLQLYYIRNIIEKQPIKITLPLGIDSNGTIIFDGKPVYNDANFPNVFFDYLENYLQINSL